jgi:hypothetical protein
VNRSTMGFGDCARRASTSIASHNFVKRSYIISVLATFDRVNWCFVRGKSEKRCNVLKPPSQKGNLKSARQKRQSSRRNDKQKRLMLVCASTPKEHRYSYPCGARIWKKDAVCRLIIDIIIMNMFVLRVRVGAISMETRDYF